MKYSLFIWCFLMPHILSAQLRNASSTAELAAGIAGRYPDQEQRVSAAYRWVVQNMRYSTDGAFALNNRPDPRDRIDVAFDNRAGVCENFASIFVDLCRKMGYMAEVIQGYTMQNGHTDNSGHSWAAVRMGSSWYLFDPTWDAGSTAGFRFYKQPGDAFKGTHIPFDPIWQLEGSEPDRKRQGRFANVPADSADPVTRYVTSDSLTRVEAAAERITHASARNSLTETHVKVLKSEIEMMRQDEQMMWYDRAVALMNEAAHKLNDIAEWRNHFTADGGLPKLDFQNTLALVDHHLDSALSCLRKVDESKAVLVFGTGPAREQIARLKKSSAGHRIYFKQLVARAPKL